MTIPVDTMLSGCDRRRRRGFLDAWAAGGRVGGRGRGRSPNVRTHERTIYFVVDNTQSVVGSE